MKYLVLYEGEFDGEDVKSYEILEGRKTTYEFLKSIIEYIDLEASMVISEIATLKEAVTVKEFFIIISPYFPEDSFDITDYIMEE
jgi:hypothetical protein